MGVTMPTESSSIPAERRLWRYMPFSRFLWLLQCKQLWLARADLLGDPWEIALAGDQLQHVIRRHPPPALPLKPGPLESAMERIKRIIPQWRKTTFVNCWCASEHESHALWRIYCGAVDGVALETNYGKLTASLNGPKLLPVSYGDPGSNTRTPTLEDLVTKKRPMFEYEQEFRIVHTVQGAGETVGHQLDWDPEDHLVSIRVHPEADDSFMQTVTTAVADYAASLKEAVVWSDMRARPPV
jgi:hypothetical protein